MCLSLNSNIVLKTSSRNSVTKFMTIGAMSCAMMRTIKSETNKRNSGNHSDGQCNGGTDEDSGGLAKKQM